MDKNLFYAVFFGIRISFLWKQFGSQKKNIPRVVFTNFSQHMPFDGLSKSTIVDITEDSSEESEDEDVSYIPSMNLEDHCYEEDVDQNSDDNIMCG